MRSPKTWTWCEEQLRRTASDGSAETSLPLPLQGPITAKFVTLQETVTESEDFAGIWPPRGTHVRHTSEAALSAWPEQAGALSDCWTLSRGIFRQTKLHIIKHTQETGACTHLKLRLCNRNLTTMFHALNEAGRLEGCWSHDGHDNAYDEKIADVGAPMQR